MDKLSWRTREYFHREKTSDWYWIVSIITVSIALIAIILNNVIFAILIVVSSFTLSLFASKKPAELEVEINQSGVAFGKTLYPYNNLDSFWIETKEMHPRILLKSKKLLMPLIVIFIEQMNPDKIRERLSQNLKEEELSEPLLEKILIYFGF